MKKIPKNTSLQELAAFRKAIRVSEAQADRGEVISHERAIKASKRWIEFYETILASEAEADRGEVISHEQLEKESREWIKKATRRKSARSNGQKRRSGR